ncbi:MAG TPA: hypothetical protein PLH16_02610 [Candidatus Omnitrophota bacterium]|nr:hypothetical protein [Candidatus Omnitrophota bacterium]
MSARFVRIGDNIHSSCNLQSVMEALEKTPGRRRRHLFDAGVAMGA